jgi:hypothetical protein
MARVGIAGCDQGCETSRRKAMASRVTLGLLCVGLLGACATAPERTPVPTVRGATIALHLRNVLRLWGPDVDRAAAQLARERPEGLDGPLRLVRVFRPGRLTESEVAVRFGVGSDGRVIDAELMNISAGLGKESIALSVLNAVRLWQFVPPARAGEPTAFCCIEVTIENLPDQ